MDITEELMRRMVEVRIDHDDTQRSLAAELNVNHVQWANYERGQHELPVRYLVEFCRHYRVSADYLLGLPRGLEWPRG